MVNGRRRLGEIVRKKRPVMLGVRDHHVLRALRKARCMHTSDFVSLGIFPSLAMARRRLLKLHDHGVVTGVVRQLQAETEWTLARDGFQLLGEKKKSGDSARHLGAHHFLVVRFWSLVVAACFRGEGTLKRFRFEWELPERTLNPLTLHRPDAILSLAVAKEEFAYLVEVDNATQSIPYVAREKLAVFAQLFAVKADVAGVLPRALLISTTTAERLAAIEKAGAEIQAPIFGIVVTSGTMTLSLRSGWRRFGKGVDIGIIMPTRGGA